MPAVWRKWKRCNCALFASSKPGERAAASNSLRWAHPDLVCGPSYRYSGLEFEKREVSAGLPPAARVDQIGVAQRQHGRQRDVAVQDGRNAFGGAAVSVSMPISNSS